WLKTLYRKRAVTWPFIFYTIIWTLSRWGIEITSFNRNIAFHVECDCGELAKSVYQKNYFYCPKCHRRYGVHGT
ncbi:hypothetical protein, partial [Enterococcus faecium]|uniref:hypothetical protein n=1 Tax=Enterococcus faecium TaxID=1352 RepID=UPI003D76969E